MSTPVHPFAGVGTTACPPRKKNPALAPPPDRREPPLLSPLLARVAGGPAGFIVMLLLVCGGGRDGPQPGLQHQSLHTEARVKGRGGERDRVAAKDSREARDTADGMPAKDREDWLDRPGRGGYRKKSEKEQIMV